MKSREFIYIAFIVILGFFLMKNDKPGINNDVVKIDSTKVDVVIPKDSGQFVSKKPKPIIKEIFVSDSIKYKKLLSELKIKYNKIVDSTILLKELLGAKQIREYRETYEDSSIVANVYEKVEGTLLERRFSYITKPKKITYYEKKTTIEKYPDYALYLGLNFQTSTVFNNSAFGVDLSYQNKKGNILTLGYNSQNHILIGFKKRLFVRY